MCTAFLLFYQTFDWLDENFPTHSFFILEIEGAKQFFSFKLLVTIFHWAGVISFTELHITFWYCSRTTESKSKSISCKLILKDPMLNFFLSLQSQNYIMKHWASVIEPNFKRTVWSVKLQVDLKRDIKFFHRINAKLNVSHIKIVPSLISNVVKMLSNCIQLTIDLTILQVFVDSYHYSRIFIYLSTFNSSIPAISPVSLWVFGQFL